LTSTLPPSHAHAKRPKEPEHFVIRLRERIVTESEIKAATFSSPYFFLVEEHLRTLASVMRMGGHL
jgi:hypothetical protein